MSPSLDPQQFVFARLSLHSMKINYLLKPEYKVKLLFREAESWTFIMPKDIAERDGLETTFACRQITLNVHSSLDAVGFLAAVTTRLAKLSVGVNPVSAYHHDHPFLGGQNQISFYHHLQVRYPKGISGHRPRSR